MAEVRENTTQLLIADIETLRTKLSIESWDVVFGGSWGSTLSLAYAQAHPMVVRALVLRGIFLGTNWEFDWTLRGGGASTLFPDRWADFVGYLPEDKRGDPMKAYHELLMSEDHATSLKAAWHWNRWELSVSTLTLAEDAYAKLDDEDWCLQHARIEVHYFVNANFLAGDKAILRSENVERIKNIPSKCSCNPGDEFRRSDTLKHISCRVGTTWSVPLALRGLCIRHYHNRSCIGHRTLGIVLW